MTVIMALPDPRGPISRVVPSSSITSANFKLKAMMEEMKSSPTLLVPRNAQDFQIHEMFVPRKFSAIRYIETVLLPYNYNKLLLLFWDGYYREVFLILDRQVSL